MNKAETIYYSGQGYIYRCPECDKADRMPWASVKAGKTAECRFCKKEFELDPKLDMTPNLYKVIQEINYLETGSVCGAAFDMLIDVKHKNKGIGMKKKYYLVPVEMIESLDELKESMSYMKSHNTGSGTHRGEVAAKIELYEKIKQCKKIDLED